MNSVDSLFQFLAFLLAASAFIISVFSFFYYRSYLRRRTGQKRILSELQTEVDNILKSIDETADRDVSVLEEKERSLKALLLDIERRHKALIRDMERGFEELGKMRCRVDTAAESIPAIPAEAVAEEKDGISTDAGPAFPLPGFSVVEGADEPPSMRGQIHDLLRAGFTVPIIASRLGLSIAEVEFAAALLERRGAQ